MDLFNVVTSVLGFSKNYNHFGVQLFGGSGFSVMKRKQILELVLSNPAMVKVLALQCDLFSMGKFYAYRNGNEVQNSRVLDLLKAPRGTTKSQFLWDWMFWNMLGEDWVYVWDKAFPKTTKMFLLNPLFMEFPPELQYQGLIFSEETEKALGEKEVIYTQPNGKVQRIKYKDLIHFMDLTNSPTGQINPVSRLDSLYKVIVNSEEGLASKKINTEFSRKFLVAGSVDAMDVTQRMLGSKEKEDIEKKVQGDKSVHAVKSMVEIRRFVENMKNMELSQSYLADYFLIGNMYNIPRDVLEAYQSATYENQEKARASHVAYTMEPKGEELCLGFHKFFGEDENIEIVLSWDHLPFVQVMELDREKLKEQKLKNLDTMLKMGIGQEEALKYLDLDFNPFEYGNKQSQPAITAEETAQNSGGQPSEPPADTEPQNENQGLDGGGDDTEE